ncbi:MAG: ATP-grasp domain-containing protein, partial [Gemmatimonadales bacterium]|nr:ATP-grasp domain-containing protein [Gemmatimonadales bacterium]
MKAMDVSTPVLVLHLHHGSLGIARSLGRLGIPVYGMGSDAEGAVSSSRYFRHVFPWNFSAEPPERSVAELLRVSQAIGRQAILIPGADDLVLLVAENRDRLASRYRFSQLEPALV